MKIKYIKLLISLLFDGIGLVSYFVPQFGEFIDIVWAPLSAFLLMKLYQNKVSKYTAIIGFVEEILPFTDFVPSFTITWCLSYLIEKKND